MFPPEGGNPKRYSDNGIDAEKRKQRQFFALAERFRNEQGPEAANRLGSELGRMVFGG